MKRTLFAALAVLGGTPLAAAAPQAPRQQLEHLYPDSEAEWGYTQAIAVGETIYLSGTIGGATTVEEQMRGAYADISKTLARYGATMQDVVKETVYTTDMAGLAAANAVRKGPIPLTGAAAAR